MGLAEAIHLRAADGGEVELVLASVDNLLVICPAGGLEPDTEYRWTVDEVEGRHYNHVAPQTVEVGTTRFRTASRSSMAPIADRADCQRWANAAVDDLPACGPSDTGGPP